MNRLTENKVILVVRATRLADLRARFATKDQAKFYVSRLGADFSDYEREDGAYQAAIRETQQTLSEVGRVQVVQRAMLPNFVFGAGDTVIALGQDGLVANTLKYLDVSRSSARIPIQSATTASSCRFACRICAGFSRKSLQDGAPSGRSAWRSRS